ncbi:hypothetical protein UY3_04589 [Chelonia mydas]|uniref:Uncharacterized protein n=1 Tax=Chelonia mydas TaxID=8469 RepID=M7BK07_CHEMY|nr:hypothetical protein UY3_04589 [Chelonia mydas]
MEEPKMNSARSILFPYDHFISLAAINIIFFPATEGNALPRLLIKAFRILLERKRRPCTCDILHVILARHGDCTLAAEPRLHEHKPQSLEPKGNALRLRAKQALRHPVGLNIRLNQRQERDFLERQKMKPYRFFMFSRPTAKSPYTSDKIIEYEGQNFGENDKQSTEEDISRVVPAKQHATPKSTYRTAKSNRRENEMSPFSKLYELLKNEIDVKTQKDGNEEIPMP